MYILGVMNVVRLGDRKGQQLHSWWSDHETYSFAVSPELLFAPAEKPVHAVHNVEKVSSWLSGRHVDGVQEKKFSGGKIYVCLLAIPP